MGHNEKLEVQEAKMDTDDTLVLLDKQIEEAESVVANLKALKRWTRKDETERQDSVKFQLKQNIQRNIDCINLDFLNTKRTFKKKLYWSAHPGKYIHEETGEDLTKSLNMVTGAWNGTITEWNDGIVRLIRSLDSEGIIECDMKTIHLLRNTNFHTYKDGMKKEQVENFSLVTKALQGKTVVNFINSKNEVYVIEVLNL